MGTTTAAKKQAAGVSKELSDLDRSAVLEIEEELQRLLADTFALYLKTKNFHWHMNGRHFRDYHRLLDEQAEKLFDITDEIAERARKLGATTLRSIGDIVRRQRLLDNDQKHVTADEMLEELRTDNQQLTRFLRATHAVCDRHFDVATASLIEVWIDQAEPSGVVPRRDRVGDGMSKIPELIPGYIYGRPDVATSPVSVEELVQLKISAGFTEDDERYLRLAGEVLEDQTEQIVHRWRNEIIASTPGLAKHSRTPDGDAIPEYLEKSNARFGQWIRDTCLRPYDQDWINYQQEIALRHSSFKKNQVDGVRSSPYVPMRDVIAFTGVMNETIKPYLAAKGNSADEVEKMHEAWCKAIQIQMALWIGPYADPRQAPKEW